MNRFRAIADDVVVNTAWRMPARPRFAHSRAVGRRFLRPPTGESHSLRIVSSACAAAILLIGERVETERELLRVTQEAIHNVKKHAGASQLWVQLEYGPEAIALEVRDDGLGSALLRAHDRFPGHFGLTGMRERAAAIGGKLEVTSAPETGTSVRLCAPAPEVKRERVGETR